jgi:MFS family permease
VKQEDAGTALTERQYRQNTWAFIADMALFQVAMSFVSSTTVLPSFVNALTHSEVVVGLASGITSLSWLLPQLFVASLAARTPHKKPIMVTAAWIGRPLMVLLGLAIYALGDRSPTATLVTVLAGIFIFFVIDAVVSIPWFDLVAVGVPPRRRGRILGIGQVIGGLGGILAGVVVRYVLSDTCKLAFPSNFALLYVLSGLAVVLAAVALSVLHEPKAGAGHGSVPGFREVLRSFPQILLHDRGFQWATVVRMIGGFSGLATAFYVLYGLNKLGFRAEDTGLFISAQVVGALVAGAVMGLVQDRWGPLAHVRTMLLMALVPPALALVAGPVAAAWQPGAWAIYLLLYFFLGLYVGTAGWPFFNWLMEYAPAGKRPLYIGLMNTLAAVPMLAPAMGGVIVRNLSYQAVFWVALAFGLLALSLSGKVPNTRAGQAQGHAEG